MLKATQERIRVHNAQSLMRTIYCRGPISRADVARATHLTPPTVSDVVSDLIVCDFVQEIGLAPSLRGRRAILLRVADYARRLIGIDLSRRDFRGALADLRGSINHRIELPLNGRDGEAALALVYELADALVGATTKPILGIGIGAPGLVDSAKAVLRLSVTLNWRHVPFRSLLEVRYRLPVYRRTTVSCRPGGLHVFRQARGLAAARRDQCWLWCRGQDRAAWGAHARISWWAPAEISWDSS